MRNALRKAAVIAVGIAALAMTPAPASAAAGGDPAGLLGGGCTTLSAPGGGTAHVCRTWNANGDGTYWGELSVDSASSRVYTQASRDGSVVQVSGRGQNGYVQYNGYKKVYQRACNTSCGAWW
ncbi:hypothetical protein [Longispora urticae]